MTQRPSLFRPGGQNSPDIEESTEQISFSAVKGQFSGRVPCLWAGPVLVGGSRSHRQSTFPPFGNARVSPLQIRPTVSFCCLHFPPLWVFYTLAASQKSAVITASFN